MGFFAMLALASAQSPQSEHTRHVVVQQLQKGTEVTTTVFLPFISDPNPRALVFQTACKSVPKVSGLGLLGISGIVTNTLDKPITNTQLSVSIYDVTGTVLVTKTALVYPAVTLEGQIGRFAVNHVYQQGSAVFCNSVDRARVDVQVTTWEVLNSTRIRLLTVIATRKDLIDYDREVWFVTIRNDQTISLTQAQVVARGTGSIIAPYPLTTVLAPNITATIRIETVYDNFDVGPILAQGEIYP